MSVVQAGDTAALAGVGSAKMSMEGRFAQGVRLQISGKGTIRLTLLAGNDKGEVFAGTKKVELSEEPQVVELAVDFEKGNLRLGALAPMRPTSALYIEAEKPVEVKLWGVETW